MKTNVGMIDKIIRIALGIVLLTQVFWGLETPWGWLGIVPLVTGLVGFCPLYKLLGIHTCHVKKS